MTKNTPQQNSSTKNIQNKKKTETLRDLHKRNKRLEISRNLQQEKNREKSIRLKAQSGKIDDLKVSRDIWRSHFENYESRIIQLYQQLEERDRLLNEKDKLIGSQAKLLEIEQKLRLSEIEEKNKMIDDFKKKLLK